MPNEWKLLRMNPGDVDAMTRDLATARDRVGAIGANPKSGDVAVIRDGLKVVLDQLHALLVNASSS
jgi:hypothetical protein